MWAIVLGVIGLALAYRQSKNTAAISGRVSQLAARLVHPNAIGSRPSTTDIARTSTGRIGSSSKGLFTAGTSAAAPRATATAARPAPPAQSPTGTYTPPPTPPAPTEPAPVPVVSAPAPVGDPGGADRSTRGKL